MVKLGNPAPLGLLAFGMTTIMLMYIDMGWVESEFILEVYGSTIHYGGYAQFLVAILELFKGNSFAFAVFGSYGCFWLIYSVAFAEGTLGLSEATDWEFKRGKTLVLIQWGVLTNCFWTLTFRKNVALVVIFTTLTLTFYLLAAANESGNGALLKVAGYVGFFCGLSAFYTAIAELVNEEYGRHVLPGLKPLHRPERVLLTPESIQSRVSYDEKSNTLLLSFQGISIQNSDDVKVVREAIQAAIVEGSPDGKAHVMVNYKDANISPNVSGEYWAAVAELERDHYLSVARFESSSFGTKTSYAAGPAAAPPAKQA